MCVVWTSPASNLEAFQVNETVKRIYGTKCRLVMWSIRGGSSPQRVDTLATGVSGPQQICSTWWHVLISTCKPNSRGCKCSLKVWKSEAQSRCTAFSLQNHRSAVLAAILNTHPALWNSCVGSTYSLKHCPQSGSSLEDCWATGEGQHNQHRTDSAAKLFLRVSSGPQVYHWQRKQGKRLFVIMKFP